MDLQQVKQRFGIIGNSHGLNRALSTALQVASSDLSVLITGESGTGKEVFSHIIHQYSGRKHNPHIAVNCGAIPEGTIDSELFGHEKGSFTGAVDARKGYFEVADKGTIFLDEVGELPLSTQVRLLRLLETGEFIRVGSSKSLKCDVRVVAATNVLMHGAIEEKKFREDLYYRLNTVPIMIPPLRERAEDIPLLFKKFANDAAERYRMPPLRLADDAREALMAYRWPGNVRQLKNIAEQITVIETSRDLSAASIIHYLPEQPGSTLPAVVRHTNQESQFSNEREILYKILFDLKRDVTELRQMVGELLAQQPTRQTKQPIFQTYYRDANDGFAAEPLSSPQPTIIHDTQTVVEESLSIEDKERELIKKALERWSGKRKMAAVELGISERTLYRKLKDYGMDAD